MKLEFVDWSIIFVFFVITLLVGLWSSKTAGGGYFSKDAKH